MITEFIPRHYTHPAPGLCIPAAVNNKRLGIDHLTHRLDDPVCGLEHIRGHRLPRLHFQYPYTIRRIHDEVRLDPVLITVERHPAALAGVEAVLGDLTD